MRIRCSIVALSILATGLAVQAQTVPRPAGEFAISMPYGGQTLISQFSGKVVLLAFILTTCPHCQHTTQILSGIQNEYGSRGVQIIAAAFNADAPQLIPGFITQFKPTFPVGFSNRDAVLEYEQASLAKPNYVPELIFIDRHRVIRAQYSGGDDFFKDQEANIRALLDKLVKEPAKSARSVRKVGS